MRLSKNFIREYVDLSNIDFHDLADRMVFAGNEYEEIKDLCPATNLIIGEVLECIDHPESDHLHICQVSLGTETVQIICGAPNVRTGIKVIVAQEGATLPGGITIKKAKLAGMESNGMICSLAELGLESKYLKEEDKTGIHVLGEDAVVGENPLTYLQLDDTVIDFELTANRGDLLSMLGMAYEIGAIYDRKVKLPDLSFTEMKNDINDQYQLDVQTSHCSIYLGKLVQHVVIGESPQFIKARLIASGIRPINNVVDISNYVMLEYGQPLHFFDADRLGTNVIVREAQEGEPLTTLDGKIRTLKSSDLVIANQDHAVALAGVMGGLTTEVEADTQTIFIESAIFDPVHIRYTSKSILRSEASNRYEKGIDPSRTEQALLRACQLLEQYAQGEVVGGILKYDQTSKEDKKINITLDKINQVLGMSLQNAEVEDVFRRLQFTFEFDNQEYTVYVPTRRLDVNIKEDLIEEIGRIYGYEHVKGTLPVVPMKQGSYSKKEKFTKQVQNCLQASQLQQVITYSLIGEKEIDCFVNQPHEKICLQSPMSDDKKILRQSFIPSLLHVMDYNLARNYKDILIYETGSVYYKDTEYVEETKVAGLLCGTYMQNVWQGRLIPVDFYLVKGIVENLLNYLGLAGRYQIKKSESLQNMHPKMSASILVDQEEVGYLGKVHPSMSKQDAYVFELSLDRLFAKKVRSIKFKEIPKYPSVHKDLAFIVPKELESEEISKILKKVGGRLLSELDVFDVYTGENVSENEKSIAYSLTFQDASKTLNDEEVTKIFNKMILEVETKLQAKLRNQ